MCSSGMGITNGFSVNSEMIVSCTMDDCSNGMRCIDGTFHGLISDFRLRQQGLPMGYSKFCKILNPDFQDELSLFIIISYESSCLIPCVLSLFNVDMHNYKPLT
ncbi:hypothetical protein PanWU01x14_317020 [Parasponia andersonii]|uniref:Uncharacterized protein n=1 Tax=Parasponia andersonii TaxID=3476 RepID=A0A2P5AN54_PARAD|nr:hypothetical protein PanWU01x14_317020 [Parasponia andersonii]